MSAGPGHSIAVPAACGDTLNKIDGRALWTPAAAQICRSGQRTAWLCCDMRFDSGRLNRILGPQRGAYSSWRVRRVVLEALGEAAVDYIVGAGDVGASIAC
jgi:hypothetical protein